MKKLIVGIIAIVILVIFSIYIMKQPIQIQADPIIQDFTNNGTQGFDSNYRGVNQYSEKIEYDPIVGNFLGLTTVRYYNETNKPVNELVLYNNLNVLPDDITQTTIAKELEFINSSTGWIRYKSIQQDNNKLYYKIAKDHVNISLQEPLQAYQFVELVISFDGMVPKSNISLKSVVIDKVVPTICTKEEFKEVELLKNTNSKSVFYPKASNYVLDIVAPKEYNIVATGTEIDSNESEENKKTTRIEANMVRNISIASSTNFKKDFVETENGVKINLYTTRKHDALQIERVLRQAKDIMNYFNSKVGSYPYTQIDLIESEGTLDKVEAAGLAVVSKDLFTDNSENAQSAFNDLFYQLGYQWFGNVIATNVAKDPWINESLIQYLQLDYLYSSQEINNVMDKIKNDVKKYKQNYRYSSLRKPLIKYSSEEEYYAGAIQQGMLLFYELNQQMRNEEFEKFLQRYYRTNAYRVVDTDHFSAEVQSSHLYNYDNILKKYISK